MYKKLMSVIAAAAMLFSVFVVTSEQAEARRGHGGGLAAGLAVGALLGLGLAGAAYAGPRYYRGSDVPPGCYRGPRQCGWAGRRCWVDRYGDEVCRGGEWRCWRPTVCD